MLLPEPEGPTRAVFWPDRMRKLSASRTVTPGRLGYSNVTSSKTRSWEVISGWREPEVGSGASITVNNSHAATMALLTAMSGVDMRSREVRIIMTDISTTMTTPALLMAPAMKR